MKYNKSMYGKYLYGEEENMSFIFLEVGQPFNLFKEVNQTLPPF